LDSQSVLSIATGRFSSQITLASGRVDQAVGLLRRLLAQMEQGTPLSGPPFQQSG